MFNFYLGKYINLAVNAPKKYPRKPFFEKEETEDKQMTSNAMEAFARRFTERKGGSVK
jgi:hypothetical protein